MLDKKTTAKTRTIEVRFPWDGSLTAEVATSTPADVERALASAEAARPLLSGMSRAARRDVLSRMAATVRDEAEQLAETLVMETGKTVRDARGEVLRAASTLEFAAAAAATLVGEVLPLDAMAGGESRMGWTERVPIGVVAGIPAVNFPLLITVHKLAPAIGAGCPIVIKPPDRAPLSALALRRIAVTAGWPEAAVNVLPGDAGVAQVLVGDDRVRLVTFTGSTATGRAIAGLSGMKPLLLELGSNAATVIAGDADIDTAVGRCVTGSFAQNGQSCISVQRVYVHESRYEEVVHQVSEAASGLRLGDPRDETTDVGPVIDDRSANRLEQLFADAQERGGEIVVGGGRSERLIEPTVVAGLTSAMRLHREEAFGPVVALAPFRTLDEAVALVNDSDYGLQAGVFTSSLGFARQFAQRCEVGGVHINEISNWRADHMPYGGIKGSGFGREGPEYAMREMTTIKVITIRDIQEVSS